MDAWIHGALRPKAVVLALIVLPGLWPLWPFLVAPDPTVLADPPKYLLHHLGFTASVLLAVVLTLSPLRTILPRARTTAGLQRHRRLIGVSTFVYAALHVTTHFIYEGGLGTFMSDWRKPFIAVGASAFLILAALAGTSFNAAVRRLGARRWKRLHRLVYLAALLVVYHQISARKVFPWQVVWIFGPVLALQTARLAQFLRLRPKRAGRN